MKAYVVFSSNSELARLCILHPKFRHCYIIAHDGDQWFSIDPMAGYMEVAIHRHIAPDFDLPRWYEEERGLIVVEAPVLVRRKVAPPALMTCTEVCKRFLGIHNAFIITPYQLYKHLTGGRLCAKRPALTAKTPPETSRAILPGLMASGKCAPIFARGAAHGT